MQYNEECIACLVDSQLRLCRGLGTEKDRMAFMTDVCACFSKAPEGVAAPWFIPPFQEAFEKHFGISDPYREIKESANSVSLSLLPVLEKSMDEAEDRLKTALKISRTGNFLDFAVLSRETIDSDLDRFVLSGIREAELDEKEYERFSKELETAEKLVILGDNAGEIVFDTVLVKELKRSFPQLKILYVVRGGNAQNDATPEDAAVSGMDRICETIGNGTLIPGTELSCISEELLAHLHTADLILSKGQANFETLVGCGLNIYYVFLCKCPKFARRFGVPPMTGMFLNDRRNENF